MIDENNQGFAIKVHYHYLTKKKEETTSFVKVDNKADSTVKIIKQLQDVNDTYKYNMKNACREINKGLEKLEIDINVNQYVFGLFNRVYGIKDNPKFCYVHKQFSQPQYTYSMQAVELIVEEI